MNKKVVIFGCGDIGELALQYFTDDSEYEVVAFTVDSAFITDSEYHGLPVVAFEEISSKFSPADVDVFVALSYANLNGLRADKIEAVMAAGYTPASYISSRASILTKEPIGVNAFILEDNTVQPCVKIGDGVTLWSGNHIGHHSVIEDYCFISSHVVISGGVTVGERSFLGVNATLRDHIVIGKTNVIGAGCLIMEGTDDEAVYVAKGTEKARVPSSRLRNF